MNKYKLHSQLLSCYIVRNSKFVYLTFRMTSPTGNGGDSGDENTVERAAKLENLKNQKRKKMAKAERLKRFRSTVDPIAMCVSRVDVEGLVRTKDDYVEKIVRYNTRYYLYLLYDSSVG